MPWWKIAPATKKNKTREPGNHRNDMKFHGPGQNSRPAHPPGGEVMSNPKTRGPVRQARLLFLLSSSIEYRSEAIIGSNEIPYFLTESEPVCGSAPEVISHGGWNYHFRAWYGCPASNYQPTFEAAAKCAAGCGVDHTFVSCAWGDVLGVKFDGRSLPDPPTLQQIEAEESDFAQWNWLFDDPLFELDKLTIRDRSPRAVAGAVAPGQEAHIPNPSKKPEWERLWSEINAYQPSQELQLLLELGGLSEFWNEAWLQIVKAPRFLAKRSGRPRMSWPMCPILYRVPS
jgi:hypothetical protein